MSDRKRCALLLLGLFLGLGPATMGLAQPTTDMLSRVFLVETPAHERGTIFALDVDGREYWITAKHVITGARHAPWGTMPKTAQLRILNPGKDGEQWQDESFEAIDPGEQVDIAVLAPPNVILEYQLASVPTDSQGVILGGDCEFLGFPFGVGWQATFADNKKSWMPFVKHCTVSAFLGPEQRVWVLDGINNPGFSGGPVFSGTGANTRIIAVISGYRAEPLDVISTDPAAKPSSVNANSGFFFAFDIRYAIDAIKQNPIGPLLEKK